MTPGGHILQDLDGDEYPIDIVLNAGMSGGPVIDQRGQVVGLVEDGLRGSNIQGINRMLATQFVGAQLKSANVSADCQATIDLGELEEKSAKYDQLVTEAKEEANASSARDKFGEAIALRKSGWEALYGLAHIDFEEGDFEGAASLASEAFAAKAPSDYSLLSLAALANDGAGNLTQSISEYKRVLTNVERDKSLYKDALFALGQVEVELFFKRGAKKTDQILISNARENFDSFVRIGGLPLHFALYHLACIDAIEGKKSHAVADYNRTTQALRAYRGENRDNHMKLLETTLTASDAVRPGDPVPCPPLQAILRSRDITTVIHSSK